MRGFTGNRWGVRLAIVVVLGLMALGSLGYCSRAKADGLSIGFGYAFADHETCFQALLVTQEFGERWLGYLATHGRSVNCDGQNIEANIGAGVVRIQRLRQWSIGVGAGFLEHGDTIVGPQYIEPYDEPKIAPVPQFVAVIFIRRRIGDRLVLDLLHNSTGGSTYFNRGLNLITLGGRF